MASDVQAQPRPPNLLNLPPHLRHRIYLSIGVARHDGHPYTYYLDGRKESRGNRPVSDRDPPPTRDFAGLLLSCRALYVETATLLYSANRFVLHYSHQGSLGPLRSLSPTALASLTSLKVVLNQSSCHEPIDSTLYPPYCCQARRLDGPWDPYRFCDGHHGSLHRPPLLNPASRSELAVQAMLCEWDNAAAYLSSRVGVGRLAFSLVCDLDPEHRYALEAARLAVAPITHFSQLKDCHVRLSRASNYPLRRLAQEAVLQALHSTSPPRLKTPTDLLMSLPSELRVRILEYTDLITPWKEVTWSRQDRGYQVCHPPAQVTRVETESPPNIRHGCRLSHCHSGHGGRDSYSAWSPGCFCRRRHAAFSLTCHCWEPPTALFLVCRTLSREAQFVFFSGNRFVVCDFHAALPYYLPAEQYEPSIPGISNPHITNTNDTADTTTTQSYRFPRLAASEFLRDVIPPHCLTHLRFLELLFPPYIPSCWPQDDHPAISDWRDTIDYIRARVNAPALTLRIAMVDASGLMAVLTRRELSSEQEAAVLEGYRSILRPFQRLVREDGLAGFFVQAALPGRWTENTTRNIEENGEAWLAEWGQQFNETLERHVRGEDTSLDSSSRGGSRAEPEKSTWQRWLM